MSDSRDDLDKRNSDQVSNGNIDDATKSLKPDSTGNKPNSNHPESIGQYIIKRVIASGGMGTVFEGLQKNPRRSVAIKVIKGSDVSDKAIARLKYEAQMLARLRHPGIAEIYEAGTYEEYGTEFPFFAMEYIPNAKTITEYARNRKLTVTEKLELFIQVCEAVNYGHQRGIVHRDLKPDNILVDSNNRVRIIDFGLARATDFDVRQTNVHTEAGQIVGSLHYMSPEQFEADSSDLDTRSDVYSLGIVLYELISGFLPYDLSSKNVYEVAGIVKEKTPLSLSKRGIKIPDEIDIILQKCLRKERELRYQTAYGLKQDLSRFLAGDAIVARSLSLAYQVKVFTRKNKLLVGSFAAVFVLLVLGIIISTTLLVKVSEERERAFQESEKANKANRFLASIFETAIPDGFGDPVPISQLLDRSSKMLEGAFPDDPEIESDISYSLAIGYFMCGQNEEARELLNHAIALRKAALGDLDPKLREYIGSLNTLNNVTGNYEDYLANCRELCRIDSVGFGSEDEKVLSSQLDVSSALARLGNVSQALDLVEKARTEYLSNFKDDIKLGSEIDWQLAWLLLQSGRLDEAEKIARENFQTASAKIEDSWYTESSKSVLAAVMISQGKLDEAAKLYGNFPTYPDLDKEFDIQGEFNQNRNEVNLIVFWEEWCPFCDRMMGKVEKLYRQYHNYGIEFVGVTSLSKTSTVEKCNSFIDRHDVTFPVIKETGKASSYFNVPGVPSIRLIYKGKLIWERVVPTVQPISRHMLEGIVKARQT